MIVVANDQRIGHVTDQRLFILDSLLFKLSLTSGDKDIFGSVDKISINTIICYTCIFVVITELHPKHARLQVQFLHRWLSNINEIIIVSPT